MSVLSYWNRPEMYDPVPTWSSGRETSLLLMVPSSSVLVYYSGLLLPVLTLESHIFGWLPIKISLYLRWYRSGQRLVRGTLCQKLLICEFLQGAFGALGGMFGRLVLLVLSWMSSQSFTGLGRTLYWHKTHSVVSKSSAAYALTSKTHPSFIIGIQDKWLTFENKRVHERKREVNNLLVYHGHRLPAIAVTFRAEMFSSSSDAFMGAREALLDELPEPSPSCMPVSVLPAFCDKQGIGTSGTYRRLRLREWRASCSIEKFCSLVRRTCLASSASGLNFLSLAGCGLLYCPTPVELRFLM